MTEIYTKEIERLAAILDTTKSDMQKLVYAMANEKPINFSEMLYAMVRRAYEMGLTDGYQGQAPCTSPYTKLVSPIIVES